MNARVAPHEIVIKIICNAIRFARQLNELKKWLNSKAKWIVWRVFGGDK